MDRCYALLRIALLYVVINTHSLKCPGLDSKSNCHCICKTDPTVRLMHEKHTAFLARSSVSGFVYMCICLSGFISFYVTESKCENVYLGLL